MAILLDFLNFIKINILSQFLNMGIPDVNVAFSDLLHTYFFISDLLHTYFLFQICSIHIFLFQICSIHIFFILDLLHTYLPLNFNLLRILLWLSLIFIKLPQKIQSFSHFCSLTLHIFLISKNWIQPTKMPLFSFTF